MVALYGFNLALSYCLQYTESEISLTERLKSELRDCQCEIHTLKKLMSGKDYLVVQKSKALDLSKVFIL